MKCEGFTELDEAGLSKGAAAEAGKLNRAIEEVLERRAALDVRAEGISERAGLGAPPGEQEAFAQTQIRERQELWEDRTAVLKSEFKLRRRLHSFLVARLEERAGAETEAADAPDRAREAVRAVWDKLGLCPAEAALLPNDLRALLRIHPAVRAAEAERLQAQARVQEARSSVQRNEAAAVRVRAERDLAARRAEGQAQAAEKARKAAARGAEVQAEREARQAEEAAKMYALEHPFDQGE